MLAVVKKPRIEMSLSGKGAHDALSWLSKKFKVIIVSREDDTVAVENTDFWNEMQTNRVGNLLSAARLKSGLTQKQLAEKVGIKQNMISDYEKGRRPLTKKMASRFAAALNVKPARLQ
jgi:ribosome-binding protein aMBF1 (putative translation factor)